VRSKMEVKCSSEGQREQVGVACKMVSCVCGSSSNSNCNQASLVLLCCAAFEGRVEACARCA
jgi:hypothetical protein